MLPESGDLMFLTRKKLTKEELARKDRVCRSIRRIVDATTPNRMAESCSHRRSERYNRCVPVVCFPLIDKKIDSEAIYYAATKDLSDAGASIITHIRHESAQVICGFWYDGPVLLGGVIRRFRRFGGDLWEVGIEFTDVLESAPTLESLMPYVEALKVD